MPHGPGKWVTQISPDNVWNLRSPRLMTRRRPLQGSVDRRHAQAVHHRRRWPAGQSGRRRLQERRVLSSSTRPPGSCCDRTPLYTWPPIYPPETSTRARSPCPARSAACKPAAPPTTRRVYTNGIDQISLGTSADPRKTHGSAAHRGRVVSISLDTQTENWRHERPKVKSIGGTVGQSLYKDVGDPVASGIALANGVVYSRRPRATGWWRSTCGTGAVLKEIPLDRSGAARRCRAAVSTSARATSSFRPRTRAKPIFPNRSRDAVLVRLAGEDRREPVGSGKRVVGLARPT